MAGIVCRKRVVLFFVLVFLIVGLVFPRIGLAKEGLKKRVEELEKRVEELERLLSEYKALLKEIKKEAVKPAERVEVLKPEKKPPKKPSVLSKYQMELGGRIKIDTHYDTVAFESYNDFIGVISAHPDYKGDSINFNPRDTRFDLKVRHTTGNFTGFGRIETDFYGDILGNNIQPRIRLAYVDLTNNKTNTGLRVGQDWIPVPQQNPHMCEFGILAGGGNLWWRIPQITLRQRYGNFEFLASLMRHRRISVFEDQWGWPWALFRVAYSLNFLDKGSLIALGGGYMSDRRKMAIWKGKWELKGPEKRIHRWLAAFEYRLKKDPLELKGEVWVGQGLGSHFLRYDMDYNPFTGEEIRSQGGFASLLYKTPIKNVTFASGFGIDHNTTSDLKQFDWGERGDYGFYKRRFKQNLVWFGNIGYQITKGIKLMLEYIHMNTMRDDVREGNRITFSTFYSF
ncbi:MAG: hypothetical protein J7J44_01920 [Deltaproteobacteria bacterium]|nr:hypothetical protein [Deltaproteobacteria bacterium]